MFQAEYLGMRCHCLCSSYSRVQQKVWRSLHHKRWWFSCEVVSNSFATPWTVAHQAPLPMGFFRQEYWNGLPFPSPGDLPNPGIEPTSPTLAGRFFTTEPPGKLHSKVEGKTKGQLSPRTSTREKPVCCNEDTTCMCVLSCFSCV